MQLNFSEAESSNSRQLILGEMLARRARIHPDREAIVFEERRYSYRDFDTRSNQLANALLESGIRRDDNVAELLMNGNEIIEAYFGVAKAGAVNVPLNFRLKGPEIIFQLQDSEAKVLIFGDEFVAVAETVREEMPDLRFVCVGPNCPSYATSYDEFIGSTAGSSPGVPISDDDSAFIMYTSGTTGKPKGAVLTHKNILMNVVNATIDFYLSLGEYQDERWLFVAPVFHTAAAALSFICFFRGGTACYMKAFDPQQAVQAIQDEKITNVFFPPVMSTFMLNTVDIASYDTSSLRMYGSGASVLPTETRKQIKVAFPNVKLFDGFGQTEMSPLTCMLKPGDADSKTASIGKPLINVEVRIVDDNDRDVEPGQPGEIIYRGPTTMKEYYKNPHATAEALRGGWFHSGDVVRQDEEGFIYVVDRKKDVIISGGENIYPVEIEEVLYQHPKILEAAVIGVHDEVWGESVMAVVVPKADSDLTADEVMGWCAERLAGYKKPKHVDFIDALPRNAAMKVLKTELRDKYGSKAVQY